MIQLILYIIFLVVVALVVGNVLIAYFPHWRYHPLGEFIYNCSEPMLEPLRRRIPRADRQRPLPRCLAVLFIVLAAVVMEIINVLLSIRIRVHHM